MYTLGNPMRYVDPDGQEEREGLMAGVVINTSAEVIWIAADVGDEAEVIPLSPGESSATYFQDTDAIGIDPGVVTQSGAVLGPSIGGADMGAFKIGVSVVEVVDAGPLSLGLNRNAGYAVSELLGRAGLVGVEEAKLLGWVIPSDRQAAEGKKEDLRKAVLLHGRSPAVAFFVPGSLGVGG